MGMPTAPGDGPIGGTAGPRRPAPPGSRGTRRLVAAGTLAAAALAGCGSHTAAVPPTSSSVVPTTGAAPTSTTAPPSADVSYLTAYGATVAGFNANHQTDPGRSGGYWPRLPDGRDTYASLQIAGGRVVGYTLALDPAMSASDARDRLANDLPLDAKVTGDRRLAGCEQLVEDSATLAAATGARVLAELRSSGSYDPAAVTTITTAPLAPGTPPPTGC